MKSNTHSFRWIMDVILFVGFWLAAMLDLTGLAVHQWLGLGVGLLAGYHLIAHWSWVKSVTARFTGRTSAQARRFYLVDAGLFVGFSLIVLTGLLISTWLDLSLASFAAWRSLHVIATVVTLGFVVIKIGLHWRWILNVSRKVFQLERPVQSDPVTQRSCDPAGMDRRNFLKLMGVVSLAALVAAHNALESEVSAAAEGTAGVATSQVSSRGRSSAAFFDDRASNSTDTCQVRCNRRCSYPGHCRRYTDSNNNGRCDLGECQE